jgi:hypothetical protein
MKFPRQYSFRAMLVVLLIAASYLGYTQWWRAEIRERIQKSHAAWTVRARLTGNWFWPEVSADIEVPRNISYGDDRLHRLVSQLKKLGVDDVRIDTNGN